jgi:nitric oxide reductase NorD protein
MSLDEALFALLWRVLRARRQARQRAAPDPHTAYLAVLRAPLTLVARALSGEPLELQAAEHAGGFVGAVLYLPQSMSTATTLEENTQAYLYRLAYTVTSRQLGLTLGMGAAGEPEWQAFHTLLAVPATLRALECALPMTCALRAQLFPLFLSARPPWPRLATTAACLEALTQVLLGRPWPAPQATPAWRWLCHSYAAACDGGSAAEIQALWTALPRCGHRSCAGDVPPVPLWGQLLPASGHGRSLTPDQGNASTPTTFPAGTQLPGPPREHVHRVQLEQRDIEQDVLMHTFDKLETAEEFQGVTRTPDGTDELARHAEALKALDLRQVVRSPTRTQSIYQADLQLDGDMGDLEDATPAPAVAYVYDEWDGKARQYKRRWCTVYVRRAPAPTPPAAAAAAAILRQHTRTIRDLRLVLEKMRSTRVQRNRQPEGAEVDLDAVVDRYATARSGHPPDDRLYLARRRQTRDLATLLLVDLSASTDAWIQGRRVLDIATTSVLVLGEVLAHWHERVSIAGFYSHTRRDCRFVLLKHFDEPWQRCRGALVSLEPTGYTRIGPALRHSLALLARQQAARKLLLLISDGKPTDYDRYEGRYGMADVRQAIREAHQARVHTYALAVDVRAKHYLPQMFGSGNFQILPHPAHLVRSLVAIYGRLAY